MIGDRLIKKPRLPEMMGKDIRLLSRDFGKLSLDRLGNSGMELLTPALEETAIGRVLDQRMLESVDGLRRTPPGENQFGIDKLANRFQEIGLGKRRYRGEELIGKLPPNGSPHLGHFLDRRQTIQPCHQAVLQSGRNGQWR